MTEEPRPASLENTPRLKPCTTTVLMAAPAAPPAAAMGVKAVLNIAPMAGSIARKLTATITRPQARNSTTMKGTTFSAKAATRLRPPSVMDAASATSARPIIRE